MSRASDRLAIILLMLLVADPGSSIATTDDEASTLSGKFRDVARRATPTVLRVKSRGQLVTPPGPFPRFPLPPLSEVIPGEREASGLVVDARRGHVLTADHVVSDAAEVVVVLADGRERPANRIARDPRSDLALLTIEADELEGADWGESGALEVGDWVVAVGFPEGLPATISVGVVSGKGRSINPTQASDLIQADVSLAPGFSGGPLLDLEGRVVGINIALQRQGATLDRIGFAIPAEKARRVADDLSRFGLVRRAMLGVRVDEADPREVARVGRQAGVRVGSVGVGSPAEAAGIVPGDQIVKVGDQPVRSASELQAAVEFAEIGAPLPIVVLRDEEELGVEVRPAELAGQSPGGRPTPKPDELDPSATRIPPPSD